MYENCDSFEPRNRTKYAYDSLQRLVSAQTTGPEWGEAYTYDGFGNLTGKTPTKGSAPALAATYNPATNQPYNGNYDANGNAPIGAWDIENRLVSQTLDGQQITWGYDPSNKRFLKYAVVNGQPTWTFYLYNIAGQQVAEMTCNLGGAACSFTRVNTYFGNKLIASTDASGRILGATDRLGSVRAAKNGGTWTGMSYYPWGEEKSPVTSDGVPKFGTYTRDSTLAGQDYADQRYYSNAMGRFYSPDLKGGSNLADPGSWNRFAYVQGDPVNFNDPAGSQVADPDAMCRGRSNDMWWNGCISGGVGGVAVLFYWNGEGYVPYPVEIEGSPYPGGDPSGGGGAGAGKETRFQNALVGAQRAHVALGSSLTSAVPANSRFSSAILDCMAGMETDWNPQANGPGARTGLFQYNQQTWEAEYNNDGTPWSIANAQSVVTSLDHTLGGLNYRLDAVIKVHPDWTFDQQMARALSLFNGEFGKYGATGYGEAVMNCAGVIGSDFSAGYRYIWDARNQ